MMSKPVYRKSVLSPEKTIDVTGYITEGPNGAYVEINQGGSIVYVNRAFARSLAGHIAAAAAKIEVELLTQG